MVRTRRVCAGRGREVLRRFVLRNGKPVHHGPGCSGVAVHPYGLTHATHARTFGPTPISEEQTHVDRHHR
ncbi:hypothetical protein GCM10010519_74780 [Streptomyces lactacystinicus]